MELRRPEYAHIRQQFQEWPTTIVDFLGALFELESSI